MKLYRLKIVNTGRYIDGVWTDKSKADIECMKQNELIDSKLYKCVVEEFESMD